MFCYCDGQTLHAIINQQRGWEGKGVVSIFYGIFVVIGSYEFVALFDLLMSLFSNVAQNFGNQKHTGFLTWECFPLELAYIKALWMLFTLLLGVLSVYTDCCLLLFQVKCKKVGFPREQHCTKKIIFLNLDFVHLSQCMSVLDVVNDLSLDVLRESKILFRRSPWRC